MSEIRSTAFSEGQSITRPPLFDGTNYNYWKARMMIYLKSFDYELWDSIEEGYKIPTTLNTEGIIVNTPKDKWDVSQKKLANLNAKAMNSIYCALNTTEFNRISSCSSAHDIWEFLQVTHEGTDQVKESRISRLTHDYELFHMKSNESINEMFTRFGNITNGLHALGKIISESDRVRKVLRFLGKEWKIKVAAIDEGNDLTKMSLQVLTGKLITYEMDVLEHSNEEESPRKGKNLALKASSLNLENYEEHEDEELAMMIKGFKKFINKRKSQNQFSNNNQANCFRCNKPGHIQKDCYTNIKDTQRSFKANDQKKKITWDDDSESDNDESKDEVKAYVAEIDDEQDREAPSKVTFSNLKDEITWEEMKNMLYRII